ncbi:similar to Saccharomyces cerevisiae YGL070C RPB9 RNA polymerase II subunit B12.6 [Geotrichum candidum]|uniref:DNA-directed RNA polymerase subunit n=1 Tax=Geotrichum candidum TaxID=1173061 RepID=A0A0J9XG66_GEOCN|nr:similar to Saccharomyces cerevisiae YGL070C RPB9 RNA polymerase II subunit B12.6 [Geotrichum candidum]
MSFRFCLECNNMLYPHADNANHRLLYSCRNCDYSEVAEDAMVYYHKLDRELSETAGVTNDVGEDPTLPRSNKECPKCHWKECVFFQSQQRRAQTSMVLFYVCLNPECHHTFRSV